mmetsp:Transcript_4091/g.9631  ORF Transcript_4091/g.9631 Transcript_4091/m.9631 type:complete len:228 (+) Transcript_4091:562-1245(+)
MDGLMEDEATPVTNKLLGAELAELALTHSAVPQENQVQGSTTLVCRTEGTSTTHARDGRRHAHREHGVRVGEALAAKAVWHHDMEPFLTVRITGCTSLPRLLPHGRKGAFPAPEFQSAFHRQHLDEIGHVFHGLGGCFDGERSHLFCDDIVGHADAPLVPAGVGGRAIATVVWARPDRLGILGVADAEPSPLLEAVAILCERIRLNLVLVQRVEVQMESDGHRVVLV